MHSNVYLIYTHILVGDETMAQAQYKSSPINIRALTSQKALIDKAAAQQHKSRSEFILDSACREATNVLLDQRLFITDNKTYQAFIKLLESPVADNLGLKALLRSKSPWEN